MPCLLLAPPAAPAQSTSVLRAFGAGAQALRASELAVVVNDDDPLSVRVGEYYLRARKVPARNLVRVRIPGSPPVLTAAQFEPLRQQILSRLGKQVQAVVMVWTAPYAVECNSITSALARGFDPEQCKNSCAEGSSSPYFDSNSTRPYGDFNLRLAMLLPISSEAAAKALIDRGVKSDGSAPPAGAYYLVTADPHRNSRAPFFPPSQVLLAPPLRISTVKADSLQYRRDVMIYQTGLVQVPGLDTLGFLPGALADHLTSAGGQLLDSPQMSSLKWLDAGATASYGTVSEPCNHWQKFPNPAVLLRHYLNGETAIEAYWKSVAWPAQGLFIGEPLAAPYRRR